MRADDQLGQKMPSWSFPPSGRQWFICLSRSSIKKNTVLMVNIYIVDNFFNWTSLYTYIKISLLLAKLTIKARLE